ncbi:orotidine 5'-phosphate decarboxylase / HUMPS family protein [Enterococcus sp. BWR-S5]|uniref:orotidine 5'-phosphate decarboxylase / HUMPS family protein n=1 Tax=Enterococcus sp. BWR-S5 TaxID=2787714 RepID=UPI001923E7A2|nr:orotidine 5'-phosphate decarboxylase / HUMPS family protein [Enterococcus sp. BWR-S5]MBL1226030.1 orotidine 5'-phosphate decarboxylase [Enterococcus sp. BWR-S5]
MNIQVAIDRVTLEQAKVLTEQLNTADIIEIGTSLTKDYGLACVHELLPYKGEAKLLADIKTIDEGAYEFRQYFEAGADILTVMGASAVATLDSCYEVTQDFGKEMLIDLLECSDEKIAKISHYPDAIYSLHFSSDAGGEHDVVKALQEFTQKFPTIRRLALAGGLTAKSLEELKHTPLEIGIIGGAVTKADEPKEALNRIIEVIKG